MSRTARGLAEIGHGVEVEIERVAGEQCFPGELAVPGGEQVRDFFGLFADSHGQCEFELAGD